jgi:glycosyltransferase involved in cell wall biosynthesis
MSAGNQNLSVYMPAYNVALFVSDAVHSILEQTWADFEFIIVDDGSTDSTPDVLRDIAGTDPRIRLIHQPNAGVSVASNHAVSLASGEFLARVDADDIARPDRLEKQLRYMREHPDCVALGSAMMLIDEQGFPLYPMASITYGHQNIDTALLNGGWPIAQPSCMYRRDAILAAGGYRRELSLHEDHDLFLRLAERGRLENLPEILQQYRQRDTSLMARESARTHNAVMHEILRQARERRGLPSADDAKTDTASPVPPVERYRKWAWRSLKAGNVATARKYARAALRGDPISSASWKLMYCALRGH